MHTLPVQHHWIPTPALQLHAIEFGPSDGVPLVLLHGVTGHSWIWHDVVAALGTRRIIALDARGHGDSQWSADGAYSTADLADDLSVVIKALDLGKVDIAGSSWGALVGLTYAARCPGHVGRLAMIDVEPSFAQTEDQVPARPGHFRTMQELIDWERLANPNAHETTLRLHAMSSVRPAHDGGFVRKHDPFFLKRWPFRRGDHWEELRSLDIPLLIVRAEQSFVSGDVVERMAREAKRTWLADVPESTHVVPLEQPTLLAGLLADFRE